MAGTGILLNNMRSLSPECDTTFWMMTVYSDTLFRSGITTIFDPITDLNLITEFDFLPTSNCKMFPENICNGCGMQTEDAYFSRHLVLSYFGTCKWSNVKTNRSLTCLVTTAWRLLTAYNKLLILKISVTWIHLAKSCN